MRPVGERRKNKNPSTISIASPLRWHTLTTLTLYNTNLTGFIPKHWNPKLTHMDFSNNKLNGTIPTSLTLLESLKFLNLSSNQLTGEIPTSFGDLISL
ncbi:putative non-specific serine/threonine protein kinase [Helianthus annuus]|nr:putative non-specific serine/threonine protein kinase [Helianthus annuus]KAJ0508913.1 putative non-specific serine/threonine protein kinase [Helianthus annuus]KAJ0517080.1 putative non-specific serine/threonine protein kinase [Helianthus annuus]KAJ0685089.1 putative non-specific serine/threonine protein kinase [Helianthus annuus]KAJ0689006.1 putative non-specific serine/threonine protein kinase [Helianthus annuus]